MGSQKAQKADYTLSVTGRQGAAVSIAVSGRVALDSLQALMAEVRAVLRDPVSLTGHHRPWRRDVP